MKQVSQSYLQNEEKSLKQAAMSKYDDKVFFLKKCLLHCSDHSV